MCGINGIYSKNTNGALAIKSAINTMNNLIIHRGPDDDGFFNNENKNYCLGMAMRRLSIIDLHTGEQPMYSKDRSKVLVFNGEIYNYKALKNQLGLEGITFKTASDTEVIMSLYEFYGVASFSMLDGMFAFSIYDKTIDKIYVTRDYFGEKPLYYYKDETNFYWASELKSIVNVLPITPALSKQAMALYFQLTYIPAPFTIYKNIHKLKPYHYIEFDCNTTELTIHEISQSSDVDYTGISFSEAKEITHTLVDESVQSRSVSDVPIGSFLSGGVDSSIVSLCLANYSNSPIDTFSIGFDKKSFDETDKSQTVSKLIGSKHHEIIVSVDALKNDIDAILLNFDEPFADSSALPTYLIANKTKSHVKVALTGDGGDEVFGGYNKYYMGKLNEKYTRMIPRAMHKNILKNATSFLKTKDDNRGKRFKISRFLKAINYENNFYYNIISLGFQENEMADLLNTQHVYDEAMEYFKNGELINTLSQYRSVDKQLSLEGDMLVKADRSSMLNSMECRAPFLNKALWNFTNQLPENFLIKGWDKKHILKESFKAYFPKDFLNKSKKGFGVPVGDWLRTYLKQELLSYIDSNLLKNQGLFNEVYIKKIVINHINGKEDNTFRVWTFFCFQKWYTKVYIK